MNYQLHCGESAEILKQYPDNHFDSIVTDPPYMIGFLGKKWDAADIDMAPVFQECIRVLKPGGHILAFSAARTYHHLAITLEQAGFEIRDQIMWIYGSGFPKSQDVGKNNNMPEWSGWGTQLKPAHEPIALARKPMSQPIAKNCREWGVGAINIDACRVPYENEEDIQTYLNNKAGPAERGTGVHGDPIGMFEKSVGYKTIKKEITREEDLPQGRFPANVIGEIDEPYQKYFYCPKVSRKERNIGCEEIEPKLKEAAHFRPNHMEKALNGEDGNPFGRYQPINNNHPTVKPIELMKYLIKLVTPPNGRVLDPFNGSGSTGCAAVSLGHHYTGIDLDQHYIDISHKRIQAYNTSTYNDFFEEEV